MADQTLAQLPSVPSGATLAELTFYTTVTVGGVATDYAITGTQLLALLGGSSGSENDLSLTQGTTTVTAFGG